VNIAESAAKWVELHRAGKEETRCSLNNRHSEQPELYLTFSSWSLS